MENSRVPRWLPNLLSIIRVLLVPVFVATLIFMRKIPVWGIIVPVAIYIITALTDALDGFIARKYNLVTEFGKFIDPLADKFMVISSMIAILAWLIMTAKTEMDVNFVYDFLFVTVIILLRELTVTGLRLAVKGEVDLGANIFGKLKTVSQMVGTVVIMAERKTAFLGSPVIDFIRENHILSYIALAVMLFTTIWSMVEYMKAYLPLIDFKK